MSVQTTVKITDTTDTMQTSHTTVQPSLSPLVQEMKGVQSIAIITVSSAQDNDRTDKKLGCVCMQGLVGSVPNLGRQISSKMTSLSLQNTSLVQCNATHLSALYTAATYGQVPPFLNTLIKLREQLMHKKCEFC